MWELPTLILTQLFICAKWWVIDLRVRNRWIYSLHYSQTPSTCHHICSTSCCRTKTRALISYQRSRRCCQSWMSLCCFCCCRRPEWSACCQCRQSHEENQEETTADWAFGRETENWRDPQQWAEGEGRSKTTLNNHPAKLKALWICQAVKFHGPMHLDHLSSPNLVWLYRLRCVRTASSTSTALWFLRVFNLILWPKLCFIQAHDTDCPL